jgi:hypothetical protein
MNMLRGRRALILLVPALVCAADEASDLSAVAPAQLCVTEGALAPAQRGTLSVDAPKMRAYVNRPTTDAAELRFTYLGPSTVQSRLGSGASREQFGLKIRAANACNLLYVMWRVAPQSALVVSVKENPGQQTSAECANRGYRNLRATRTGALPVLAPGDSHQLRVVTQGAELRALVDGQLVWQGSIGTDAARLSGPVGVRSDNTRFEFTLLAAQPAAADAPAPACRSADASE